MWAPPPSRTLSIVVPILNEKKNLTALLRHLSTIGAEQLILVDGGSTDGTDVWLQQHWANQEQQRWLVKSKPGRAVQMNNGARIAETDIILFLHADTRLPDSAKSEISDARDANYFWGRFDVQFEPASRINRAMAVIAFFINIRSRLSSIATGDQAIFVDRAMFAQLGGFPQIPLMEDIALSKIFKKQGVPHCSYSKVRTSARRWQNHGVIKTVVQMWFIRAAYFFGMSPLKLAKIYRPAR